MTTQTDSLRPTKPIRVLADVLGFRRSFRTHDDMTMERFI